MANTVAVLNLLVNAQTGAAIGKLSALDGKLKQTATTAQGTSVAVGPKLAKAAKLGAVGLAAGLGAALVSASNKSRNFEKQMSNLGAVADANNRQMKRLEKQAIRLGAATQFSATEAAQAQIELAKGGLSVKQILGGGLQSALALAAAGELDLAAAGETVVNTMGLFGLKGKDTMKIADMLATAANKTTTDVADLAMSLKMGGAVAKQAGYDLNNTVQVLEALAESGVKNSDAGTSMKTAMIQMLNPTAKQAELAKQLGIEWINRNGQMKSAIQISKSLRAATDGMTKAERTKTFAVLAGTDGFRTLAALYDAGPKKLEGYARANDKQGEAARIAAKKMDNLEGDLEELSGAWETLQLMVGGPVNKALRKAVQAITDVVRAAANLKMEDVTRTWDKYKGTVIIVATALGMAAAAMVAYKTTLAITSAINAVRNAQIALNIAMTANPVGLVIAALAALAVGLVVAYRKVDWFRDAVDAVWKFVRGGAEKLIEFFKTHWAKILPIIAGPVGVMAVAVIKHWDRIESAVKGVVDWFKGVPGSLGDVWGTIKDIFRDGANAVIDVVNAVIDVINMIPGVPDIGKVGTIGAGVTRRQRTLDSVYDKSVVSGPGMGRQRGGSIFGGRPSGDSIPAMLERGEYVLNRKAVRAIGASRLDAINFGAVPRFQSGGFLGDVVGKVAGAARDVIGRGAGFFLKQLPRPNLPAPFTGLGPYIIDNVAAWIRGRAPKGTGASVGLGSAPASLQAAMALAHKMGLTITSTTGGKHTANSWHYKGRAFDASNGTGPTAEMMQFALEVARRWGSKTLEMFYDPLGWFIKNGAKAMGAIGGHSNHVHVAMQKGGKVTGRVSYFNDGTTASGISAASRPGLALNLKPGTDSGWNNATTQGWMAAARGGKPVYGRFTVAGKSAVLPIIDLGPAGWTGRAIDVTQKGLEKMGFTTANFPTDAVGRVKILGGLDAVKKAGRASGTGGKSKVAAGKIGSAVQLTSPADKRATLGGVASQLPKSIQRLLRSPGITGAGRMAAADMAVTLADATKGIDDDRLALQYRIGLNRRRVARLNSQLGNINKRLASRKLGPAQRKKLRARRDEILSDLGGIKGSIISDRSAVAGLREPGGSETDALADAIAAAAEAQREYAEEIKALRDEIKRENDQRQHVMAISSRAAMRAMTDMISGQIAGHTRTAAPSGAWNQQVRL